MYESFFESINLCGIIISIPIKKRDKVVMNDNQRLKLYQKRFEGSKRVNYYRQCNK